MAILEQSASTEPVMGDSLFPFLRENDPEASSGEGIRLAQDRRTGRSVADEILGVERRLGSPPQPVKPDDGHEVIPSQAEREGPARTVDANVEVDFRNIEGTHQNLNALFYDKITINNLPKDVRIAHWADDSGHFFFFKPAQGVASTDKGTHYELADGTRVPKGHFFYSPYATKLTVPDRPGIPGGTQDLNEQRKLVDDAYQKANGKPHKAYEAYERNYHNFASLTRGGDPITYMRNVAGLGESALNQQTQMLEQLAKNSNNPYFKIYLADMYVAQAMLPIIKPLTGGQGFGMNSPDMIKLNNPETVRKLDQAIEVLRSVRDTSNGTLQSQGMRTRPNVVLPLAPFAERNSREGFYYYWGGSYDQAAHRELQVEMLKNLIKIMPVLELPPIQPPK